MATKAELEAQIAELETQLATSASAADPREAGMTRLVGMLKAVKQIGTAQPDLPVAVSAILTNSTSVRGRDGIDVRVDLPIDSLIARDNGSPIASQLLEIARTTEWARVSVSGYWTVFGEITRNDRGYPIAQRRQLRVMRVEVLNSQLRQEEDLSLPDYDPTNQEQFAPF